MFIFEPNFFNTDIVERQSSPIKKLDIFAFPAARELNITALCDIDLSGGIVISPLSEFDLFKLNSI